MGPVYLIHIILGSGYSAAQSKRCVGPVLSQTSFSPALPAGPPGKLVLRWPNSTSVGPFLGGERWERGNNGAEGGHSHWQGSPGRGVEPESGSYAKSKPPSPGCCRLVRLNSRSNLRSPISLDGTYPKENILLHHGEFQCNPNRC